MGRWVPLNHVKGWRAANGELTYRPFVVADASGVTSQTAFVATDYRIPRLDNFVVEARISEGGHSAGVSETTEQDSYGIIVGAIPRGIAVGEVFTYDFNLPAVFGRVSTNPHLVAEGAEFEPGRGRYHTFRMYVAHGDFRLLIDGRSRAVARTRLPAGPVRVGLFSVGVLLHVSSFKVYTVQ